MHPVRFLATVLFVAFTFSPTAVAQDSSDGAEEDLPLLQRVDSLGFDALQRGVVTAHFPAEHRDRAERLGTRAEQALQLFADSLGAELDEFHLILLDEKRWDHFMDVPYGLPGAGHDPPSAILPADAEGVVYKQLLGLKQCLSPTHRKQLVQTGLSWEEAARHYVEAITFHEVGHVIPDTDAYEIRMPLWLDEFLANYLGYEYLYNSEPEYARVWDLTAKVTLDCYKPSHERTLEKSMHLGQGPDDYHWLQSFLIERANRVVEAHGFAFGRKAKEAFRAQSSPEDPLFKKARSLEADRETISDEVALDRIKEINGEILRRLEQIAPGFQAWANRFRRDPD